MTVIVALRDKVNDCFWIGADTQGTRGDMSTQWGNKIIDLNLEIINNTGETIRTDKITIGVSGSHYLQQFLNNVFKVPPMNKNDNFMEYYYNTFQKRLRETLKENDLLLCKDGVSDNESSILLIYDNELYRICSDFSIMKEEVYYCVGAGWKEATTVIENNLLHRSNLSSEENIKEALYTTGKLNIYCSEEYILRRIKW